MKCAHLSSLSGLLLASLAASPDSDPELCPPAPDAEIDDPEVVEDDDPEGKNLEMPMPIPILASIPLGGGGGFLRILFPGVGMGTADEDATLRRLLEEARGRRVPGPEEEEGDIGDPELVIVVAMSN